MMVLLLLTLALQLLFGFTCTASHWDVVSEAESSFAFCSIWPWALRPFLLLFSQCNHSEQISLLYAWKLNACLAWLSAPHPGQSEPMNIFEISSQTKMWRPWTLNLIPAEAKYNVAFYQAFITLHRKKTVLFHCIWKTGRLHFIEGKKTVLNELRWRFHSPYERENLFKCYQEMYKAWYDMAAHSCWERQCHKFTHDLKVLNEIMSQNNSLCIVCAGPCRTGQEGEAGERRQKDGQEIWQLCKWRQVRQLPCGRLATHGPKLLQWKKFLGRFLCRAGFMNIPQ